jgi:hypothetical protein
MVTFACLFPARPGLGGSIWGLINPGMSHCCDHTAGPVYVGLTLQPRLDCSQIFHA